MSTEAKTHTFFQDPISRLFKYGKGEYSQEEVKKIINLLPDGDEAICITWVKPKSTNPAYVPYERKN